MSPTPTHTQPFCSCTTLVTYAILLTLPELCHPSLTLLHSYTLFLNLVTPSLHPCGPFYILLEPSLTSLIPLCTSPKLHCITPTHPHPSSSFIMLPSHCCASLHPSPRLVPPSHFVQSHTSSPNLAMPSMHLPLLSLALPFLYYCTLPHMFAYLLCPHLFSW